MGVRARESLKGTSTALLVEITHTVEEYADKTFKLINGNQQKIADNYLSLKAYAVSAEDKLVKYVGHGKGKNLSSLGDLMINIAALADVEIEKEEGLSPSGELPAIFSSGSVKVDNSVSKLNGLEGLAVRMGTYEATLAKLTASLSGKPKSTKAAEIYVPPPEYDGK